MAEFLAFTGFLMILFGEGPVLGLGVGLMIMAAILHYAFDRKVVSDREDWCDCPCHDYPADDETVCLVKS